MDAPTKGHCVSFLSWRFTPRVVIVAMLGIASCPSICSAQDPDLPLHAATPDFTVMPPASAALEAPAPRLGVLLPLYVSFAGLQMLDAHSTMRALRAGGSERNPLLRDLADSPAGLLAVKAGVTASTILLSEKLRVKHRVGAMVLMTALNSAYTMVVVHNYRASP